MAKVQIDFDIPDRMMRDLLQYVRTWESQRTNEVHMNIWIPESKITGEEMLAIFNSLKPSIPHRGIIQYPGERQKGKHEN